MFCVAAVLLVGAKRRPNIPEHVAEAASRLNLARSTASLTASACENVLLFAGLVRLMDDTRERVGRLQVRQGLDWRQLHSAAR
jgi:hypothetical protein